MSGASSSASSQNPNQPDTFADSSNSSALSTAADNLFLPFHGVFNFGNQNSQLEATIPQIFGSNICLSSPDYNPIVISPNYSCPLHFYCPNTLSPEIDPISLPSICPPTLECQLLRLSSHFCQPQGKYEPAPCPLGFYCPDYRQKIICPEGSFCPTGSIAPRPCYHPFSSCPEGSGAQLYYGSLIFCAVIDFLLIITYLYLRLRRSRAESRRTREESRRMVGRSIGTISETVHSKKRAQFITLATGTPILDAEDEDSTVPKHHGFLCRSYWRKRAKIFRSYLDWFLGLDSKVEGKHDEESQTVFWSEDEADVTVFNTTHIPSDHHDFPLPSSPSESTFCRSRATSMHSRHVSNADGLADSTPRAISRRGLHQQHSRHFSLHLNDLLMGYQKAQDGDDLSLTFEFDRLALMLPSGKTILNGVTGQIVPGKVTVIMGPSGAGKSTFMNVLMGKLKRTGGRLLINGREVEMHSYKKLVGYVPQDDVMIFELSVRENILYSARSRLPTSWTKKEVEKFVDAVLEALDLVHVADNLISSVSGGQRKRVNIGMELVTCPSAIFLDEPTSGLDSTAALKVANTMKKIATMVGISVVAVVHQPRYEIFSEFDDVLMVAPGGSTAYLGPRADLIGYFENLGFYFPPLNNPADILMDIIGGKGLRIPLALRNEPNILEMAAEGKIHYSEYEVSELVNAWNDFQLALNNVDSHDIEAAQKEVDEESGNISERQNHSDKSSVDTTTRIDEIVISHANSMEHPSSESTTPVMKPVDIPKPLVRFSLNEIRKKSILSSHESKTSFPESEEQSKSHIRLHQACTKRGANFFLQLVYSHNRSILQQYRLINGFLLELLVAIVAGTIIGLAVSSYDGALYQGLLMAPFTLISPAPIELVVPMLSLIMSCTIGLAGSPAGVKIFSEEREVYFREASAGLNPLAYYLGKNISATYRFVVSALHFTSFFHFFAKPNTYFFPMYVIHFSTFAAVYGLSFVFAMIVKRENASMIAVCASLVFAVFCGSGPSVADMNSWGLGWFLDMSYARWGAEAWYGKELIVYQDVYEIYNVSAKLFGYTIGRFWFDIFMIIAIGFVFRLIGLALMVCLQRHKQR